MNRSLERKGGLSWGWERRGGVLMLLFMVAVGVNFFCNLYSPNYDGVLWDAADPQVFCMDGRAWAHGYVPYVDFEDCKGPLLFFIHMCGYVLSKWLIGGCGREMMFLINIICNVATLFYLFKTALIFCPEKWKAIVASTIPLFSLFSPDLSLAGGQPEVYSIVFLAIFLYYFTGNFYGKQSSFNMTTAALMSGVAIGGTFLIKYTHTLPILVGTSLMLLSVKDRKSFFLFLAWSIAGISVVIVPFFIYMLATASLDDFARIYLIGNTLSYFGSHQSSFSHGICVASLVNLISYCIREPKTFYSFVSLPFLLLAPFRGSRRRICRINVPCWMMMMIFALSICASGWGAFNYYQLYGSVLLLFPAVFFLSHCQSPPSKMTLLIILALISSFVVRQNGMWYEKNRIQKTKKGLLKLDEIICTQKEPKILNFGGLELGLGMKAHSLPACPQWIVLNAYHYDYEKSQLEAVRKRKADFIIVTGEDRHHNYGVEFRKNGYIYIGKGRDDTRMEYYVWKKV